MKIQFQCYMQNLHINFVLHVYLNDNMLFILTDLIALKKGGFCHRNFSDFLDHYIKSCILFRFQLRSFSSIVQSIVIYGQSREIDGAEG